MSILYTGRQSFVAIYTVIVTMIATMTALAGPALLFYWSIQQDQRTVLNLTYSFIKEWREERLIDAIFTIDEYFNDHTNDYSNAKYNLYNYSLAKENNRLFLAVKVLLNYVECVAGACQQEEGHVDVKVIRQYFEPAFFIFYDRLKPFIVSIRNSENMDKLNEHITADIYSDFENLVKSWKTK